MAGEAAQHVGRFIEAPGQNQIARRFRDDRSKAAIDGGRNGRGNEHPAPGLEVQPQPLSGAARGSSQPIVTQQRDQNAGDDRELLQRAEASAIGGRRDLRDIGRRDHARGSNGRAAEETEQAQGVDIPGEAGADRACEENHRRDFHHDNAAVALGKRARKPGSERRAEQGAGHREAEQPGGRAGPVLDGIDRAIDDGSVEAEQKPSHRRGRCDQRDPADRGAAGR
jgi:hypothetical protein